MYHLHYNTSQGPQVRAVEVAAQQAALDGTLKIEQALQDAATRNSNAAMVADLRARLWEEKTAAAALSAEKKRLIEELAISAAELKQARRCGTSQEHPRLSTLELGP